MNFSINIPTIETDRLVLRGFEERDLDALAELWADEDVTRFLGGKKSRSDTWRAMASILGHWFLRGFGFFCVEERSSGQSIGYCGPWRPEGWPENEIGYGFSKAAQGKGYATEATKTSLQFAYQTLGWSSAISLIDPQNAASQNVAQKLGATLDQTGVDVTDFTADIWRHLPKEEFLERYA